MSAVGGGDVWMASRRLQGVHAAVHALIQRVLRSTACTNVWGVKRRAPGECRRLTSVQRDSSVGGRIERGGQARIL